MKKMIKKTLLNGNKKTTNHCARKTRKNIKKSKSPKYEIVSITGHTTEAGVDANDGVDKKQQKATSFAVDYHKPKSKRTKLPLYHIISK